MHKAVWLAAMVIATGTTGTASFAGPLQEGWSSEVEGTLPRTEIPMHFDPLLGRRIVISARIGKAPMSKFLVDTGCTGPCVLDKETANESGVQLSGEHQTVQPGNVNGHLSNKLSMAIMTTAGQQEVIIGAAFVQDADAGPVSSENVHGIIGASMLFAYGAAFDFGRGMFILNPGHAPADWGAPIAELPVTERNGQYRVPIRAGNQTYEAVIDTGSPLTCRVPEVASKLTVASAGVQTVLLPGTSRKGYFRGLRVRGLKLGTADIGNLLVVSDPKLPYTNAVGNVLGLDVLARYRVFLDPVRHVLALYVPAPGTLLPGLPGEPCLWVKDTSSGCVVSEVIGDQPAAHTGIAVGDFVASVDGRNVEKLSAGDVTELLLGFAGTRAQVTYKRAGRTATATFVRPSVLPDTVPWSGRLIGFSLSPQSDSRIRVATVDAGSPAEKAGIQPGSYVLAVGGMRLTDKNQDAFITALREATASGRIQLTWEPIAGPPEKTAVLIPGPPAPSSGH